MKLFPSLLAVFSLLIGVTLTDNLSAGNQEIKAVQTNDTISLYRQNETAPFATLSAKSVPGTIVDVVPVNGPFVGLRVSPVCEGKSKIVKSLNIPDITLSDSFKADQVKVLGTAGLTKISDNPGSYMFTAVANPDSNKGVVAAWLTTNKASGIVFTKQTETNKIVIQAEAQYGRWEIPAQADAASLQGEILLVGLFDDCRIGLEEYGNLIADYYKIKLHPQPAGYCTWYSNQFGRAGQEQSTREFIDMAAEQLAPFGFTVFQIDDGWQKGGSRNGPNKNFTQHNPQGPYPSGMKATADYIKSKGFTAGLWLMASSGNWNDPYYADKQDWFVKGAVNYPAPGQENTRRFKQTISIGKPYDTFWGGTCFDFTNPVVQNYVKNEFDQISNNWGYKYFKMDGLWTAMGVMQNYINDGYSADDIGDQIFKDMSKPQVEIFRDALKLYRAGAGEDSFFLGCCIAQNMRSMGASYGLLDAVRIGPDNGANWGGICRGPVRGTARYFYNGRVWYNDPDPVYVRDGVPLCQSRLICTWAAISGQLYLFSDWLPTLSEQRVDLLKRTMAPHRCYNARPVDLFESELANIWNLTDGKYTILGLFNWNAKDKLTLNKPVEKFDLDADSTYVGYDFWSNSFIVPFKGSFTTEISPASCRAISLRKMESNPVLVSTSRHVCSPLFDVQNEAWDNQQLVLSGTSMVVGNDAYELRIISSNGLKLAADALSVEGNNSNTVSKPIITQQGPCIRILFTSSQSGKINWKVRFEKGAAEAAVIPQPKNFKVDASYSIATLTWDNGLNYGYELVKTDKSKNTEHFFISGTQYTDTNIQLGETYTYQLIARGWGQDNSVPAEVTVAIPAKIEIPAAPALPELNIADMKAKKAAVGWGYLKPNKSIGGETISLNGKQYDKGVGVHAPSSLTYEIPADKKQFVATVGISDSQRSDSRRSVIIKIWTDVCEMGEPEVCVAQSPILGEKTVDFWNFDLNVGERAKLIRLEVSDAADGRACDHADWVNTGFRK